MENFVRKGDGRDGGLLLFPNPCCDQVLFAVAVPTIRDRIVQQACKIVIEPIFEANFLDSSYGFRPKRDAKQATEKVKKELYKNWYVVDADIQGYFDNINHEILLGLLKRRISDRRVIKLCRQWLQAGVIENGKYYPTEKGSPQGGLCGAPHNPPYAERVIMPSQ